jgi:predicted nuclease with TOPRIM domain
MTKSRRVRWSRNIARMGKMNEYRIFVGKVEGRKLLGRPRLRLEYIKLDLIERERDNEVVWSGLICLRMWSNGSLL